MSPTVRARTAAGSLIILGFIALTASAVAAWSPPGTTATGGTCTGQGGRTPIVWTIFNQETGNPGSPATVVRDDVTVTPNFPTTSPGFGVPLPNTGFSSITLTTTVPDVYEGPVKLTYVMRWAGTNGSDARGGEATVNVMSCSGPVGTTPPTTAPCAPGPTTTTGPPMTCVPVTTTTGPPPPPSTSPSTTRPPVLVPPPSTTTPLQPCGPPTPTTAPTTSHPPTCIPVSTTTTPPPSTTTTTCPPDSTTTTSTTTTSTTAPPVTLPPTTAPPPPPSTTSSTSTTLPSTTTTPAPTSTTTDPPVTAPPTSAGPTPPVPPPAPVTSVAVLSAAGQTLPVTGSSSGPLAAAGAALILAGLALVRRQRALEAS